MWYLRPWFWLIISIICLLIYSILFHGADYINCWKICKQYKQIFEVRGKVQYRHFLFFLLFPIPLAIASSLHLVVETSVNPNSSYESNLLNTLGVVVSVLTATLYMYLGTISTKSKEIAENNEIDADRYARFKIIHEETVNVINYEILLSIILLILCFIKPTFLSCDFIFYQFEKISLGLQWGLDTLIFYLFYAFVLNLLIVTKRFNILSKFDA